MSKQYSPRAGGKVTLHWSVKHEQAWAAAQILKKQVMELQLESALDEITELRKDKKRLDKLEKWALLRGDVRIVRIGNDDRLLFLASITPIESFPANLRAAIDEAE